MSGHAVHGVFRWVRKLQGQIRVVRFFTYVKMEGGHARDATDWRWVMPSCLRVSGWDSNWDLDPGCRVRLRFAMAMTQVLIHRRDFDASP